MEAFAFYLLKSVAWLSGFALVFILFLRNERFFMLNRIYLLSGILTSFLLPLISIHYTIVLPAVPSGNPDVSVSGITQGTVTDSVLKITNLLMILYLLGSLVVLTLIIRQGRSVLKIVKKSEVILQEPFRLVRTSDCTSAFSFFSYVFVNPSVTDLETKEILNHELVHISQKHWFDLLLVEMLCMMQWFNPLVWMYVRFIRQNHEYLADEVALQRTSDPAIYRAALLNQIVGSPVVILANSFNYSLNKKRFNMMKNIISSPYRKMRVLLILPVFAIVLYAFAKPDYRYSSPGGNPGNKTTLATLDQNEVKGVVVKKDGQPLSGAIITIRETTIGTITDNNGSFLIGKVPDNGLLVVSFVGFKSKVLKPDFKAEMKIVMEGDTVNYTGRKTGIPAPPPPPPPPPSTQTTPVGITGPDSENPPLYVIDGKIEKSGISKLDPETIESMNVLKDESATAKYGDKGKNGVIEITMKKNQAVDKNKQPFVVVEEMPEFPGGTEAMNEWISSNLKYPAAALKKKIEGKVVVNFVVTASGKVNDAKVVRSASPELNDEALRLISSMPDWKPGTQAGKGVDVNVRVPVEFKLR